jgi:hypothetical protein
MRLLLSHDAWLDGQWLRFDECFVVGVESNRDLAV